MTTKNVELYDRSGVDQGYLRNNQNWWFDPTFPHAFELFSIKSFYNGTYFREDHLDATTCKTIADAVLNEGEAILQDKVSSILEVGCGGGWITKAFFERGLDIVALEGSPEGIASALAKGIPRERLRQHDLRRPIDLGRKFSMAVCTEVAEHIECPFSATLVQTLVDHAEIVWFSFESPGTNDAHYHHCNEQPAKFWINLFKFHDYRGYALPADLRTRLAGRGTHVFVSPRVTLPSSATPLSVESPATSLGQTAAGSLPRRLARKVLPPMAIDLARWAMRGVRRIS